MIVNRQKLLQQLQSVEAGVSPREIVEQSSCFIFKDGKVMTFNDEVACSHSCVLDIEGAVQAGPLLAFLEHFQEDELKIEEGENVLEISGRKRKVEVSMEAEILLPIDKVEPPKKWKTLPEDFCEAVQIVQNCAGKDETKYFLTCVHLTPNSIQASDDDQIIQYDIDLPLKHNVLVRRDSIKSVATLGMSKYSESETWIHFKNSLGLVVSCAKYLDDEWPDVSKILAVEGEKLTFPKGLSEAAKGAKIASSEKTAKDNDDRIKVELRKGKLRIEGKGASSKYVEFKNIGYEGKNLAFYIRPDLLVDIVKRQTECEITSNVLKINGSSFTYVSSLSPVEK